MKNIGDNIDMSVKSVNLLNAELNPICQLLALLGAHHIFHVSVLRVKGIGLKNACPEMLSSRSLRSS